MLCGPILRKIGIEKNNFPIFFYKFADVVK